MTYEEIFEDSY